VGINTEQTGIRDYWNVGKIKKRNKDYQESWDIGVLGKV